VNWHWEALLYVIDAALKLELSDRHVKCVNAIRAVLVSNPPKPRTATLIADANA
jgi:hypothetical protein